MNLNRLSAKALRVFFIALWIFQSAGAQTLVGDVWAKPTAPLGVEGIVDVIQKGSEYWAVGPDGVFKSTNLTTWSRVTTTGLADGLLCIRWTGSRFVATGLGGWTSTDGISWTRRIGFFPQYPLGMATRGNTVVAAGQLGAVHTSTDGGITWSRADLGVNYTFTGVAATASQFVIVGNGGAVFNSPDGLIWTERNSSTQRNFNDVTLAGTRLVAVGDDLTVATSADNGNTWSSYQVSGGAGVPFTTVIGDGTSTVMATDANIARSSNPTLPSAIGFLGTPNTQSRLLCGVRGSTGWVLAGLGSTIVTSTDTNTWTLRHPTSASNYFSVARTSSNFLAAGFPGDKFMRSGDGLTWAAVNTGVAATDALTCLAWSGTRLVAGTGTGKIYSSTAADGTGLTLRTSGTTQRLYSCTWTGSQFLMGGSGGTILSSADGTTWASRTSGTTADLLGSASSGSVHVLCGAVAGQFSGTGVILTSTNGISWTQTATIPNYPVLGAGWNGSGFTVVGYQGIILTSPDGQNWTERQIELRDDGTAFNSNLTGVTWAGSNWIATTAQGGVVLSRDGIIWKPQPVAGGTFVNTITFGASRAVMVGAAGQILTSVATAPVAPSFILPPIGITLLGGTYGALACIARGTPSLTYQWYKDGVALVGETRSVLEFYNANSQNTGSYNVQVTGPGGNISSPPETVIVQARPQITVDPASQAVEENSAVSLAVTAVGVGPLQYQWFKVNSGALAGRTSSSLPLTNVTPASAGEYYVEVSNPYGTSTSTVAVLTITRPLTNALDLPLGLTVQTGGNASWEGIFDFSNDGVDAGRSGMIPDGGVSWIELQIANHPAVSFSWNVSSETNFDSLLFYANGVLIDAISGTGGGWRQITHLLDPLVATTLRWEYRKDGSAVQGQDRAWLDQVVFAPLTAVTDFPAWATSLPAGQRNPSDRNGPLQLENTLSYALGVDAFTATPSQVPSLQAAGAQWHFTYSRTRRTTDTAYRVEWATDLAATTWATAGVVHEQTATLVDRTLWRAVITPPPEASRLFVRLRVALAGSGG